MKIIQLLEYDHRFDKLDAGVFGILKPEIIRAAQNVYDEWDQSDPDADEYGGGGICDAIADAICGVLSDHANVECQTTFDSSEHHTSVIAQLPDGVYQVDIPPHVYERGYGYQWQKIPNVQFEESDVLINKIDDDPEFYWQCVD